MGQGGRVMSWTSLPPTLLSYIQTLYISEGSGFKNQMMVPHSAPCVLLSPSSRCSRLAPSFSDPLAPVWAFCTLWGSPCSDKPLGQCLLLWDALKYLKFTLPDILHQFRLNANESPRLTHAGTYWPVQAFKDLQGGSQSRASNVVRTPAGHSQSYQQEPTLCSVQKYWHTHHLLNHPIYLHFMTS